MVSLDLNKLALLWSAADEIPELGGGGRTIAPALVLAAGNVPRGESIVDVGPWLGSTTAFLAMGSILGSADVPIYSYDRWVVDSDMVMNSWRQTRVALTVGQSLFPYWAENVSVFPTEINPVKGNVRAIEDDMLPKEPIGLLVDDCTSGRVRLDALFEKFGKLLAPGARIIMLDYYFSETKEHDRFTETVKWFAERERTFGTPKRISGARNVAAAFTYRGKV